MIKTLETQRTEFIKKAIPLVCKFGWCDLAMEEASIAIKQDKIYYKMLFPTIADIVSFFENCEDMSMLESIGKKQKEDSIRSHIGNMLKCRIKEISGGKEMLIRLKEYYFSLKHISECPKAVWNTSDVIWRACGDKSVDMNYYSKRFLLSSVIGVSIKHYLATDGHDLDEFIEKSLNKVVVIASKLKLPKMEDIPILRLFS